MGDSRQQGTGRLAEPAGQRASSRVSRRRHIHASRGTCYCRLPAAQLPPAGLIAGSLTWRSGLPACNTPRSAATHEWNGTVQCSVRCQSGDPPTPRQRPAPAAHCGLLPAARCLAVFPSQPVPTCMAWRLSGGKRHPRHALCVKGGHSRRPGCPALVWTSRRRCRAAPAGRCQP